jgi:MinD-like ATPase involved in chromosome partitioning or flagellar assembly
MNRKAISIHSSRGGTGKTLIATNLAAILASRGNNVALLDLDFRAPSLSTVFAKGIQEPVKCWLNDFLNGQCTAEQTMIDVSAKFNLKGRLLIGLANPSVEEMRNIVGKSRAWEVTAVKKVFSLLSSLFNDMNVDCCIFDTSPGVQYSSINAAVGSDVSVIVTSLDTLDLKGTENMLEELYDALAKKTVVLVNKFSPEMRIKPDENQGALIRRVKKMLKHPVIGVIPCYCDVLQSERTSVLAFEKPNHPFVGKLVEVVEKLEDFAKTNLEESVC